jgi:hypothetical protein
VGYRSTVYCKVANDEIEEFKKLELANHPYCEKQNKPDECYTYYITEHVKFYEEYPEVLEMQRFFDGNNLSGMTCIGEDEVEHDRLGNAYDISVVAEIDW